MIMPKARSMTFAAFAGLLAGASAFLVAQAPDDKDTFLRQSRGVNHPKNIGEWRKGEQRGDLKAYPSVRAGTPNPTGGLHLFGGSGVTSFSGPDLGMPFEDFRKAMEAQRPAVDKAARDLLEQRFNLDCKTDPKITMSRGKPLPIGPTGRLPKGIATWEQYASLSPDEIREADAFPYKPLEHPLQSTAHMVFPSSWTKVHTEHERFDVGLDIPEAYLPEYPPALYLTTHPELGDVT